MLQPFSVYFQWIDEGLRKPHFCAITANPQQGPVSTD